MNAETIALNLALLMPLTTCAWLMALPRSGSRRVVPAIAWLVLLAMTAVPLGGFLAALVAQAFGEVLVLAPFSWVDEPLKAISILGVCGLIGGSTSFSLAMLIRGLVGLPSGRPQANS